MFKLREYPTMTFCTTLDVCCVCVFGQLATVSDRHDYVHLGVAATVEHDIRCTTRFALVPVPGSVFHGLT